MTTQQSDNSLRARLRRLRRPRILGALAVTLLGGGVAAWGIAQRRAPRPVPKAVFWGRQRVQLPGDGVGPLFHRRYFVDFDAPRLRLRPLMDKIKAELAEFSPKLLADFTKVKGLPGEMQVGDEYTIEILGPWNGDVRVSEVTPTSFTFVTLEGHPEAGQITFALRRQPTRPWAVRFEISSWARSRDMLVSLGYHEGKIGKVIQENAWTTFCERVVEASGGKARGEVQVVTEERSETGEVVAVV